MYLVFEEKNGTILLHLSAKTRMNTICWGVQMNDLDDVPDFLRDIVQQEQTTSDAPRPKKKIRRLNEQRSDKPRRVNSIDSTANRSNVEKRIRSLKQAEQRSPQIKPLAAQNQADSTALQAEKPLEEPQAVPYATLQMGNERKFLRVSPFESKPVEIPCLDELVGNVLLIIVQQFQQDVNSSMYDYEYYEILELRKVADGFEYLAKYLRTVLKPASATPPTQMKTSKGQRQVFNLKDLIDKYPEDANSWEKIREQEIQKAKEEELRRKRIVTGYLSLTEHLKSDSIISRSSSDEEDDL